MLMIVMEAGSGYLCWGKRLKACACAIKISEVIFCFWRASMSLRFLHALIGGISPLIFAADCRIISRLSSMLYDQLQRKAQSPALQPLVGLSLCFGKLLKAHCFWQSRLEPWKSAIAKQTKKPFRSAPAALNEVQFGMKLRREKANATKLIKALAKGAFLPLKVALRSQHLRRACARRSSPLTAP